MVKEWLWQAGFGMKILLKIYLILTSRASSGNLKHKILLQAILRAQATMQRNTFSRWKGRKSVPLVQGLLGRKDKGSQICNVSLLHFFEITAQEERGIFLKLNKKSKA